MKRIDSDDPAHNYASYTGSNEFLRSQGSSELAYSANGSNQIIGLQKVFTEGASINLTSQM